jgi:hypothetical protein
VVIIAVMAYFFAISFMNQYPAETVGPSEFACDPTIRNAKYTSMLQASVVPLSDAEQPIFDMLDGQNFTLNVDFVNTKLNCSVLSVQNIITSLVQRLALSSCVCEGGITSMSVKLPAHESTVRIMVDSVDLIGGLRIGLSGEGQVHGRSTLQPLSFRRAFSGHGDVTVAQLVSVGIDITKVNVMIHAEIVDVCCIVGGE